VRLRRLTTTLAGSLILAAGVAAAPASADSIAYVKGGDVWLSTADGARHFQVTTTGGYSAVSQADDGRLAALHGDQIAVLDRAGTVLSDIKTPVSSSTDPSKQFQGPFDPVFSPDGRRIAYTYYWQYVGYDPYCNPSTGCYLNRLYHGVGFTAPDRLTAWDEPGFRRQSGWIHPSWIDNERVLLSDPSVEPNEDTVITQPSQADSTAGFQRWFAHPDAHGWHDSELTPDGRKLAGVTGDADDQIRFADVPVVGGTGDGYPRQCAYGVKSPAGGKFSAVSWSPDGGTLAYADGAGVNVVGIPAFGPDCGTPGEPRLLIPGATSPDWGPADVPAARPVPAPGPAPKPAGKPAPKAAPKLRIATKGVRLKAALARGLRVTTPVTGVGRVTVTLTAAGRKVASGTTRARKAGDVRTTARFTTAAKKALKRKTSVRVTVRSTFRPKGAKGVTRTVKVTIRR
jgi:hypothetical protein